MEDEDKLKQEQQIWENIDLLYKKFEKGEASKKEIKKIEAISRIIRKTTASRNRSILITRSRLQKLRQKDLVYFKQELGIDTFDINREKKKETQRTSLLRYVGGGIAASLLLLFGLFALFQNRLNDSYYTAESQTIHNVNDSTVYLSDGTSVQLMAGSHLVVTHNFGERDRKVSLVGEAFFEVAKDPDKAFIVETKAMNAIVHGTSFNVTAHEQMKNIRVDVRTGCVEVADNHQSLGKLYSGDRASYNIATRETRFAKVNPEEIGAWRDGFFILDDVSVEEFTFRIAYHYGFELAIHGNSIPADAQINYHSYTPKPDIESVIQSICSVYDAEFKFNGKLIEIR